MLTALSIRFKEVKPLFPKIFESTVQFMSNLKSFFSIDSTFQYQEIIITQNEITVLT